MSHSLISSDFKPWYNGAPRCKTAVLVSTIRHNDIPEFRFLVERTTCSPSAKPSKEFNRRQSSNFIFVFTYIQLTLAMREAINLDRGFSPCFYRTFLRPTCGSAFLRPALGSVQPSLIILLVLFISAFIILDSHDCSWLVNELSRPWWFMWLSPMQLTKADANPVPSLRHVWLLRTTSRAYDKAPLNIHANHKGKTHVLVCLLYCILLLYSRLAQQSCVCTCVSWHHMELEHDVTITAPYCSRSLLTPHL